MYHALYDYSKCPYISWIVPLLQSHVHVPILLNHGEIPQYQELTTAERSKRAFFSDVIFTTESLAIFTILRICAQSGSYCPFRAV